MKPSVEFPYSEMEPNLGHISRQPRLPIELRLRDRSLQASGLLDTGSLVNVLPFQAGIDLGVNWEEQRIQIPLVGNLAEIEARGVVVQATVANFPPVHLAFAWAHSNDVPLILGQTNFFQHFDVCFFGARARFELRPHFASSIL